ncbi:MAG: FAD-dependent oxidoreductase [Gallionellaceae bacterium]
MKAKPRLVLAGGGHAHLSVLRALSQQHLDIEVVLVTPSPHQTYSGMLPGWISGHYSLADCQIDLRPLVAASGATLLIDQLIGMDASLRRVYLSNGKHLDYDYLSLDIGSEPDLSWLETAGEQLLPIKPLTEFVRRWPTILAAAAAQEDYQLIVVGGGAAGVELAFAAHYAFAKHDCKASTTLISSEHGILSGHTNRVKIRASSLLQQRGITTNQARAVATTEGVLLPSGQHLRADCLLAATGTRAPAWLRESGLELDEHGYILVGASHQSVSHAAVFAAGDICSRSDIKMAKSGVHAVFAGPVLAHNLLASLHGGKQITYQPRRRSLYLLATGPKHAIASWGAFSIQGYWVWLWKDWIDRRFMHKHKASKNDYD